MSSLAPIASGVLALALVGCAQTVKLSPQDFSDADHDGYSVATGDCDDTNATVHPGAAELCDGLDNNCNGVVDENPASPLYYTDADGDTYGDDATAVGSCIPIIGMVSIGGDCDDSNPDTHPGADEYCDDIDNNCDGIYDNNAVDATTWYADYDGDGYGSDGVTQSLCTGPAGWVSKNGDCDDSRSSVHPHATDPAGDGIDQDCSGGTYIWPATSGTDVAGATITGNHGANFPTSLCPLGDIDYDGANDILVGDAALGDSGATDAAYMYKGPIEGTLTHADAYRELDWTTGTAGFGSSCAAAGDVNASGTSDVIIGAPAAGQVELFLGERLNAWDASKPDATIQGPTTGGFGTALAGAGDVDGDGVADILVSAPSEASGSDVTGAVYVYSGADWEAWVDGPYERITGDSAIGATIASLGDVDGDGLDDFALGSPSVGSDRGEVDIFLGGPGHSTVSDAWAKIEADDAGQAFGSSMAVGDLDEDGVNELVVAGKGAKDPSSPDGRAWIFNGTTLRTGLYSPNAVAQLTLSGGPGNEYHALGVALPGDVNGDTIPDLVLSGSDPDSGTGGEMAIFLGPLATMDPNWANCPLLTPDSATRSFASLLVGLGDVNQDSHGDFGASAQTADGPVLYIYTGRAE